MRRSVVPGAAVALGFVAVESTLRPPASLPVDLAMGGLGLLLALRVGHALRAAEREGEKGRQLEETRALVELSHTLAGSTEQDATLRVVADWTRRLLGARACVIELLDAERSTLKIRAVSGLPDALIGLAQPLHHASRSVLERQPADPATSADPDTLPPDLRDRFRGATLAAVPLAYRDTPLGVLTCVGDRRFDAADLELLKALADQAALAIENARLFEQVHALSVTDPLTGLANRRQLQRDLSREFAAAHRGRHVALVMLDLDGFKAYNDRHGHLAGDEALRVVGRVLDTETRAMNLASRYGGDEFVCILSDTRREGAEAFVQRIRDRLPEEVGRLGFGPLSVSAGIALYVPEMTAPEDLLRRADEALYRAKSLRSSR
jgi:diguanylate cyclase (GGDEF)-like protein